MKKLLLILACTLQFVNAQNTIVGEYISTTKNSNGVKLYFLEDNTYQISVFSGKYKIENDSIILENDNKENSFNLLFEKGKKNVNKITIKATPYNYYSLFSSDYLGIQKTENSEIEYKLFKDYFDQNDLEEYTKSVYKAIENVDENSENKEENPERKLSFEIDRAYALYFVKYKERKSNIEKYIIPTDVNVIDVTIHDNYLSDLELSGKIEKDNSVIFLTDGKNPLSFIKKSAIKKIDYVVPSTKTSEKKWSYPNMKSREDYYDYNVDSTAVLTDSTANRYEFKAKVEKNLKEALLNLKKEPSKYLFVYNNLKEKRAEKDFNNFIEEYNTNVGYNMYSEYDATYDKFNFYLATKSDEAFLKKDKSSDNSILILNKDGKIIASSTKKLDEIAYSLNYDVIYLTNKLQETENAILLSNSVTNKKTSIPELTKSLNTNYKDFFTSNYYNTNHYTEAIEKKIDENEIIGIETDAAVAVESTDKYNYASENNDFTYYKSEVSEKILAEKLNTIFEYYNSKNIVNNELINVLLGEISGNHISFNLFKNENSTNNKLEIKYINYILKYNENEKNKSKIALVLSQIISDKQVNDPDIETYNAIANQLIAYSGNNIHIIQSAIYNFNKKGQGSEAANKLVDLFYTTLVNDKPVFENLDSQFNNLSTEIDYTMDWAGYKNRVNSLLNQQAWDIFEKNQTKDFERAIKWSELSNIVDKNNAYSLDTLGQLYFAVGRKSEAIVIQTKAVALAKELGISHEEFEKALNNMKK